LLGLYILMNPNDFTSKLHQHFECVKCAFVCSKKGDLNRHLSTRKHKILTNPNDFTSKNIAAYYCDCGKVYKHLSSLCAHKRKCSEKVATTDQNHNQDQDQEETNLIIQLLKQNQELQKSLIELSKEKSIVTNSHNKTFNLQLFLNEQCKDAINLSEFVSSIKMDLSDLETTGRLGYVEGVSRIINKNLNKLEVCKRPIHCSDLKRETLYIKNDDEWKKETEDNIEIKKAIKDVANENIKQIGEWRKEHPGCSEADSNKNDMYLKIVSNAMSGATREEQMTNYEKIVSKIAKEVVIVK